MTISVIIPALNEEKYIEKCLESIFAQNELPDEVILIDNNCKDRTVEIAKKFPVKIIKEKKQGMIQARDAGFNAATSEIIARTDADSVVPKDWVKRIKKAFADPTLCGLSGPAHFDKVPDIVQAYHWPNVLALNQTFKNVYGHDCLFGPNMSLRKKCWEEIKDEVCQRDKDVHEDIDLSIHLGRIGKIKFDRKLVIISSPRRWTKLEPYLEYPYRYFKTLDRHKNWTMRIKNRAMMPARRGKIQLDKLLNRFSLRNEE